MRYLYILFVLFFSFFVFFAIPHTAHAVVSVEEIIDGKFVEQFIWKGNHASTIGNAVSNTVWWNENNWDARIDHNNNARAKIDCPSAGGPCTEGLDHVDIHPSSPDLRDGTRTNDRYQIGGDGGPGVGVMHVAFQQIINTRLRNPMLISESQPGIVEFFASRFVSTGHWWEVSITPTDIITGGEFTAAPTAVSNTPFEDSINVLIIGRTNSPCITSRSNYPDYDVVLQGAQAINGVMVNEFKSNFIIRPIGYEERDELYAWRFEYYPDRIDVYADLDEDGTKEYIDTYNVVIPWNEVYVYFLGIAYQASHHPIGSDQDGPGGFPKCYFGQMRELTWKQIEVSPVKYARTAVYPKNNGIQQLPKELGWMGYDTRDIQRFGPPINGIPQANEEPYHKTSKYAFCLAPSSKGFPCRNSEPKTLKLDLSSEAIQNVARVQFVYDTRQLDSATLTINDVLIGQLPDYNSVPGGETARQHWVRRSLDFDPSILKEGENTFFIEQNGEVDFDRIELEFAYSLMDTTPTPTPTPTSTPTPSPTPQPSSTTFSIGDRVETIQNLNVRSIPSISGILLGEQSTGSAGTVRKGPVTTNIFIWWNIDYDTGADGWSAEKWLTKSSIPLPLNKLFLTSILNLLHIFLDNPGKLIIEGSNFTVTEDFRFRLKDPLTHEVKLVVKIKPKDENTIEIDFKTQNLSLLQPGFYIMEIERESDSDKTVHTKQLLLTKLGDLWSKDATNTTEQKRDGKIDIFDVSRLLSKWNSTNPQDLLEADINTGPNNISQGKIDLFDANRLMANWSK